jgi:uncharacterized protein
LGAVRVLLEVGDLRRPGACHSGRGNEKEFTGRDSRLEIELRGDLFVFTEVLVEGQATNVGGKIYVKGSIEAKVNLECSRCLTTFTVPIGASFEEIYYAAGSVEEGDPDDTGRIYGGEQIDLRDAIIESLVLVLPMKPVCQPDCQGLCSSCGCNLNTEHCGCGPQAPDPRLAGLGEYLKQLKD